MKLFLASLFLFTAQLTKATDNFSTEAPFQETVTGMKCQGGEASGVSERWCKPGQWLISFNGEPIIVKLKKMKDQSTLTEDFFEIIPKDYVTANKRRVLGRYWFKFDADGKVSMNLAYFHHSI